MITAINMGKYFFQMFEYNFLLFVSANYVFVIFVVLVLIFVLFLVIFKSAADSQRTEKMNDIAQKLGLSFERETKTLAVIDWVNNPIFTERPTNLLGHPLTFAKNIMQGKINETSVWIFDWHYPKGMNDDGSANIKTMTTIVLEENGSHPHFAYYIGERIIKPEDINSSLEEAFNEYKRLQALRPLFKNEIN
jgi:hypothetical protein